jgi:hypothetical protein
MSESRRLEQAGELSMELHLAAEPVVHKTGRVRDHLAVIERLVSRWPGEGGCSVGHTWWLSLEDRVLLVATHWRTSLMLRQVASLFGISKSTTDRILFGSPVEITHPCAGNAPSATWVRGQPPL